jgi:hypothetical protein
MGCLQLLTSLHSLDDGEAKGVDAAAYVSGAQPGRGLPLHNHGVGVASESARLGWVLEALGRPRAVVCLAMLGGVGGS